MLIPELNNGQLIRIIRDQFFVDAVGYNKIMGIPFTRTELIRKMRDMLEAQDQRPEGPRQRAVR